MKSQDAYEREVINPGDRLSKLFREVNYRSFNNNSAVNVIPHIPSNFRGPVGFIYKRHILEAMMDHAINPETGEIDHWTMAEEAECDGGGGKFGFHTLIGMLDSWRNAPWEIVAMTKDDFSRTGRYATVILNSLSIKKVTDANWSQAEALVLGFGSVLEKSKLVGLTGESAIMKFSITAFSDTGADDELCITWEAACLGLAHRKLLIDGSKIKHSHVLVGYIEPGYRCSGGTDLINVTKSVYGPEIKKIRRNPEAVEFVRQLTIPSQSYANNLTRLAGWKDDGRVGKPIPGLVGIAHISGGGIYHKLGDLLPDNIGADLHSMPLPTPVLLEAQRLSLQTENPFSDQKMHSTFHGSIGTIVVYKDRLSAERGIREAARDGIQAQVIGHTFSSRKKEISILSRFLEGGRIPFPKE